MPSAAVLAPGRPRSRRRLAVVLAAALLATIALGAVRASADGSSPPVGPDGATKLWVVAILGTTPAGHSALIQLGPNQTYTRGGLLLDVGPSVALSVLDNGTTVGCDNGYPVQRWLTGWTAQSAGPSPATVNGSGTQVSFDGVGDHTAGPDHYLWLYYNDSVSLFADPNPCA